MKLLTAILARLLSHLLSFAHTSVQFSLSPIMCVLDALSQFNSSLTPVKESNFNLSINQAGININDKDSVIEIENKVLNKLIEYNLQNFVREYRLNLLNF